MVEAKAKRGMGGRSLGRMGGRSYGKKGNG